MNISLSRKMSKALRHTPEEFGIELDEQGSTSIIELAEALGEPVVNLLTVVMEDDKGRFAINGTRIWAHSGHSTGANVPMVPLEVTGDLYHGTKASALDEIFESGGVTKQKRNFVHLSKDILTAVTVANRRSGLSVILTIDAARMVSDGLVIYTAGSAVLTDNVPWEYIREISVINP